MFILWSFVVIWLTLLPTINEYQCNIVLGQENQYLTREASESRFSRQIFVATNQRQEGSQMEQSYNPEQPRNIQHVVVRYKPGRFFGWLTNGGIWSWGNEILVHYKHGEFQDKPVGSHDVNYNKPITIDQSRSIDGGLTWTHSTTPIYNIKNGVSLPSAAKLTKPMMITLSIIFTMILIFAVTPSQIVANRIIATGWDSPTPSRFRKELAEFEKWGCFDGTTIAPTRKLTDGHVVDCRNAFSREHWEWAEFSEAVQDLRESKPSMAKNSFLFIYTNPGDVDWFDDEGWSEIVDHWRIIARLAREGRLRGILFDAEPYTKPYSQFLYRVQPGSKNHTFAEYCIKARERGREVMKAVIEEFPDITIMTYRLFCDLLPVLDSGDIQAAIEPNTYGLLPAFVDGWCDVMPNTVRIVEGNEDAYLFNSEEEFYRAFTKLKLGAPKFVSPENREKLRNQYYVGHGIYLDAHVNPPTSHWYIDRLGGTSAQRLAENVASALKASDGFIWIYGEKAKWWLGGNPNFPMWSEKLQGAVEAIQQARDSIAFARETMKRSKPEENVIRNGDFKQLTADGKAEDWWTWQDEHSQGQIMVDQESASFKGLANGVLGQNITVKPGESYAVKCRVRSIGRGFSCLSIGWKTSEGKWTANNFRVFFAPIGDADIKGWREALGLVRVPPGAGQMIFMLSVQGQITEDDQAWFDDCQVVKFEKTN